MENRSRRVLAGAPRSVDVIDFENPPAINPGEFRRAVGQFVTGVVVVTTRNATGQPYGFAANAFSSLSLDPPLVLVCIGKASQTRPVLVAAGGFAINVLAQEHGDVCRRFAGKGGPEKFGGVAYTDSRLGHPLIDGALAHLDCRLYAMHPGGDHMIVTGAVEGIDVRDGDPLVFWAGRYGALR